MKITLLNIGKRYNRDWIFKNISLELFSSRKYAILGPNGSGKSTLMKVFSGYLTPSEGKIVFTTSAGSPVDINHVYKAISYTAPYIDLIDEFSVREQIVFHMKFKQLINGLSADDVIRILNFEKHSDKELKNLSSGMRQRMKLVLAVLTDTPVLLLDEPATNLDKEGVEWYRQLVKQYADQKLLIIASNRLEEYDFCDAEIDIRLYK